MKNDVMRWGAGALLAGVVVVASGCNCGPTVRSQQPQIEVLDEQGNARRDIDFGRVQVATTGSRELRIRNGGAALLTITEVRFAGERFGLGEETPVSIAAGDEHRLLLTFSPTVADLRETGTATIVCDDPATPTVEVALAGTGIAAVATVMPRALDFGEVYVGESKSLTVTVTNSGSNALEVKSAQLSAGLPASVAGDLSPLITTLEAGAAASAQLTFAPTEAGALPEGGLDLELGDGLGVTHVAVSGLGVEATPRLCLKWDDEGVERCADEGAAFLQVSAGALCDAHLYPPDGGPSPCVTLGGVNAPWERAAKLYLRNEGNTPVAYSLQYNSMVGGSCDGGSTVDFEFANAPASADGGVQTTWTVPTVKLPTAATEPKPWETAPVSVVYRARSACRDDAADQARVLWTRQGEPTGTSRLPQTLILNLTGQSLLPRGVPQDVTLTGTVPMVSDFYGVGNAGDSPLEVRAISLWQAEYLANGGRGTEPYELCEAGSSGDCRFFFWAAGDPNATLPRTLAGTSSPSNPTRQVLGQLTFGAQDGGAAPVMNVPYHVFAVIETSDPYLPTIVAKVQGTAR